MLRKRSRAVQDKSKGMLMGDLSSSSGLSSDSSAEQKPKSSSFFSLPGLLVSFAGKGLSESDSMKSPTSPLDYRIFSNLALIRSPRSPGRSWDCSTVGLGLVNSLRHDIVPGRSDSKNILHGSQMRLSGITNSKKLFMGDKPLLESKGSTFSQICSSNLELDELGKTDSCSSVRNYQTENQSFDASPVVFFHGSMGCLSASEDYTCIISHGPNPKTTHIFGDRIVESCMIESPDSQNKRGSEGGGSHWIIKSSENSPPCSAADFLSYCDFCSKKLEEGRDIYMYRGEEAFCSWSCREEAILNEEEPKTEMHATDFCHFPSSATFHEEIFMEGMTVTS